MLHEILIYCLIGFSIGQIIKWLDFAMDYGHYLDFIRIRKGRNVAKRHFMADWFQQKIDFAKKLSFHERMTYMDQTYWELAEKEKGFTLWLCPVCFGTRIILLSFIGAFFVTYPLLYCLLIFGFAHKSME